MKKRITIYQAVIIAMIIVSMLPLLKISMYDHPSADDYNYSIDTYHSWKENGSVLHLLKTAAGTSAKFWNKWQGLYSSAFVLSLQPSVFGEKYYALTGFLMIFIIFAGNLIMSDSMIRHLLKGKRLTAVTCGCMMSFLMIQWIPSAVEGLYWFNGAMNYVLFFSLMEVLLAVVVKTGCAANRKNLSLTVIAASILGFIIAGGNHVTAFMTVLLLFALAVLGFVCKTMKHYRWYLLPAMITVSGFLFNVFSPGTKVRQDRFEVRPGIAGTIKASVLQGMSYINGWIGIALIVCVLLLLPLIYETVKNFRDQTEFHFRYPLLVVIASVGWICAMFCPPMYAMGNFGAGRLLNVIYFSFIILVFVNLFYLCGWMQETLLVSENGKETEIGNTWIVTAACLFIGMMLASGREMKSYFAVGMLRDGTAAVYSAEAYERNEILCNFSGAETVEVSPYSVMPGLLYFDDITSDTKDWRNKSVKNYYDLKGVVIKQ